MVASEILGPQVQHFQAAPDAAFEAWELTLGLVGSEFSEPRVWHFKLRLARRLWQMSQKIVCIESPIHIKLTSMNTDACYLGSSGRSGRNVP